MRKIKNHLTVLLAILIAQSSQGQKINTNPYNLSVTNDIAVYKQQISSDSTLRLVNLERVIPGIRLDIRYATTDNFTHQAVYSGPAAYLRYSAAMALAAVERDLEEQGLGLKVYDAYRPYAATLLFYEIVGDTNFVAAPWKGSMHNRGCAVDVGLVDIESGRELPMPTLFDDFSAKAKPTAEDIPENAKHNRKILIDAMWRHGFTVHPSEWWHYNYQDCERYGLMDLSFPEIN